MTNGRTGEAGLARRVLLRIARRNRQWLGKEPRTRVQVRTDQERYGGWWVCPFGLRRGDVVYSFDVGGDLEMERCLLRQYDARVYLFDPDPDVAARAEVEGLLEELELYAVDARTVRLARLMRALGHSRVDLLKLDVDDPGGAIRELVALDADVPQLLVAFPRTSSTSERDRVEGLVAALERQGYRISHISPDGRRYSFLRTDFVEP